jgi:hypothetical protein
MDARKQDVNPCSTLLGKSVVATEEIAVNAVDRIMRFITTYCKPLLTDYGFRLLDSGCDDVMPDVGSVLLESEDAQCYFAVERGITRAELLLYFRSKYDPRKWSWYSFDLVRMLLSGKGEAPLTGLMNESNGSFLRDHLPEIVALFRVGRVENTLKQLDHLKRARTKKL